MKRQVVLRELVPSVLVSTLAATFGVALLQATSNLAILISQDDTTGSSGTVAMLLNIVALVFIVISVYVAAVVTANTFATVIVGRTRTIALRRLIGATARQERRSVATEGIVVGLLGSAAGLVLGTALPAAGFGIGSATGAIPDASWDYLQPVVLLPVVGVVLTTWLASWIGSRRVLTVSPMQATGATHDASLAEVAGRRVRRAGSVVLFVLGTALLLFGILVGFVTPLGVLIGLVGGILSFTGLVAGADILMPPALRLVGRLLGRSAAGRLAAENAVRYPERSSRTTIGLVIGVTLVTMFAVAMSTYARMIMLAQQQNPEVYQGVDTAMVVTLTVFSVLVGFSALIAGVGMVNNLSLSVLQRTRELGLLRALGFTAGQLRQMILAEAAQLSVTAIAVGLVLGIGYGWAGAQSLLGSISGIVAPVVPGWLVAVVILAAAVLTAAASIAPTRRATRIAPVVALAVE
ncbi:MAG: ABC transporter permease [Actinomycetota bacterium]|nr:ABC transporter permease [Actinomycetota bacterium]